MKKNKEILIFAPIILCLSGCFINQNISEFQIKDTQDHINNYEDKGISDINNETSNDKISNDEISNDEISNDGISNNETSNDEISNDEISNDGISNDEISNDKISNDEISNDKISNYEINISNENNNINNNISDKNIELIEYENKKFQFKIGIPKNWNFEENNNGFDLILSTPKNDNINENLGIKIQEPKVKQDIETYTEKTVKELELLYDNFINIGTKGTKFNNGKSIIYEFNSNGLNLKAQQTVFLINNNAYIFTYTATKDTFNQYIETIDEIINSFNLLD